MSGSRKARDAVLTFQRANDGSFWKDTKVATAGVETTLSGTTTARCYMALVYADRCCEEFRDHESWKHAFRAYVSKLDLDWEAEGEPKLILTGSPSKEESLNNFEIAHVADLAFVKQFLERYDSPVTAPALEHQRLRESLGTHFQKLTIALQTSGSLTKTGRLPMQETEGEHFFVNLHAARAHAILDLEPPWTKASLDQLKRYCREQCFYAQRGLGHKLDTIQLILAGVTCALFDDHPSLDLYEALVDAIQAAQLPGGNWPATHPVFLKGGKPWHITSHEMALCLTWLYHVPEVSEDSRQKLLSMMERYFEQWVVKTYVPHEQHYRGWYDDHHIDDRYVVGWATSIVCHFLANYYWILGHEVNRLVIESLGLEDSAEHYSFDGAAPELARRLFDKKNPWSDLPPHAWDPNKGTDDVAAKLRERWTDPSKGQAISETLARKIVAPILDASGARPGRSRCTGMLNGPPGTRKTSFVKCTARAIGWPLVTVPGSVILATGWDGMEARATAVFRRLRLLTNCVIFFDEYEEFFRAREPVVEGPAPAVDNRTVAAFMTSGMLPRLQDLHDERRCLVFLATNFPEAIDPAVRRAGRFDFNLDIQHPHAERAIEYLDEPASSIRQELERLARGRVEPIVRGVKQALCDYVSATGPDTPIPFKNIEDALRSAARGRDDEVTERARRVLERGIDMDAPPLDQLD